MWQYLVEGVTQLLLFFYAMSGNYGIAIIIMAILIKIVVSPLTHRQFKAMKEMQKLHPYLKELQTKYKNNPKELQKRTMALFREHKVNPFGSCLLLLIQMPILILLWQALMLSQSNFAKEVFLWTDNTTIGLSLFTQTSFLWMPTLMSPDMILLILYGISMYVTQKITTIPSADPSQQQLQNMMAIMMPIFLVIILKTLPAALILYWFVFNILSTIEQYLILKLPLLKEVKK